MTFISFVTHILSFVSIEKDEHIQEHGLDLLPSFTFLKNKTKP